MRIIGIRTAAFAALVVIAILTLAVKAPTQLADPASSALALQQAAGEAAAPADAAVAYTQHDPAALAQTGQPPRTLRAYWHLFIAFAVTWLLLFGYVITIGRRWARLEREVQALGVE